MRTLRNSINWVYIEIAVTTLCHKLQNANVSHLKQKRLLFNIDYVCEIPRGREQDFFQPLVYILFKNSVFLMESWCNGIL